MPKWAPRKASDISRQEIIDVIEAMATRRCANRLLATISTVYSLAVARGIVANSPAMRIPRITKEHGRERTLTDAELRAVWPALDNEAPAVPAFSSWRCVHHVTAPRPGARPAGEFSRQHRTVRSKRLSVCRLPSGRGDGVQGSGHRVAAML